MPILKFPDGFLWGAATSAHQVEGDNTNDWSVWENEQANTLAAQAYSKFGHLPHWPRLRTIAENPDTYRSGQACDHYRHYAQDFDLAKQLGHNAHRFSLEWSRIEPQLGTYSEEAVAHYRTVLEALRARGLTPFVTLWHWTLPLWLAQQGGVASPQFPDYFERYARFVVERLGDLATHWITLNEPTSVIAAAYVNGQWPPQKRSLSTAWRTLHILARAHCQAYRVIHSVQATAQVGLANLLHSFEPYCTSSWLDRLAVRIGRSVTNEKMFKLTAGCHDFLGVNYYFHDRLKFPRKVRVGDKPLNDLGWEIYPEGLYHVIKALIPYQLPIYITENGLADTLDDRRFNFIHDHLIWLHQAIAQGADVKGYFYWSLLDNFEWDKGFWPRFGLVHVDYQTQTRTIRESAWRYADICRTNTVRI